MSREEILRAALALDPAARIALSVALLESIEPEDDGVGAAWLAEIERRDAEIDSGDVELVDGQAVFAEYGLPLDP